MSALTDFQEWWTSLNHHVGKSIAKEAWMTQQARLDEINAKIENAAKDLKGAEAKAMQIVQMLDQSVTRINELAQRNAELEKIVDSYSVLSEIQSVVNETLREEKK